MLAAEHFGKYCCFLRIGGVERQLVHTKMDARRSQAHRARSARDFFHGHDVREIGPSRTTIFRD